LRIQSRFRIASFSYLLAALSLANLTSGVEARKPSTPSRVEFRLSTADHVTLRLIRLGNASSRPPLILVSGWTIGLEAWEPVAEALARDRQVYMLDSRSQGRSTISTGANTPEDRGRDLATIIHSLKLQRPVVIAWSQGVQDLSAYLLKEGDAKLSGSVLVDTVPSGGSNDIAADPQAARLTMERLALYRRAPAEYEKGMMQFIISRPNAQAIRSRLVQIALATPPTIGADMLVSDLFGADRTGVRFTRPVLLIAASSNPDLLKMRNWADQHGARFVPVDAAAHAVFIDQPNAFLSAFRAWE
jgi:pimeloyl-ACP methyl ester carboxylesterase